MEAKLSVFRRVINPQIAIFLMLCWHSGCGSHANMPQLLNENKIVKVSRLWRTDTNQEIKERIVVGPDDGFYVVIELEAMDDHPSEVDGNEVTDSSHWPCVAVSYPKGSDSTSKDAIRFQIAPLYLPKSMEFTTPILAPPGPHMKLPNYQGPLTFKRKAIQQQDIRKNSFYTTGPLNVTKEIPSDIKKSPTKIEDDFAEGVSPYWTFFGPTHDEPGEYIIEILVYPFFPGRVGEPIGDAVSVYKGILEITQ